MPLKIVHVDFGDQGFGYDVIINSEIASVQDYLDALNNAVLDLELTRTREKTGLCMGCDGCCGERIPLTMVDLERISESPRVSGLISSEELSYEEKLQRILRRFGHIYVNGRAVDITLRLTPENKCIFLNQDTRTCSIYQHRPFVCQTFICCPASREALALREALVNAGEDELVRRWINRARDMENDFWFDDADAPDIVLEDWKTGPFSGKNRYSELLLKEVLPGDLWAQLYKGT